MDTAWPGRPPGEDMGKYRAVTRDELRATLGGQCSPMRDREGYVIGPANNGRLCHVSTHFSMAEARHKANILNGKEETKE